MKMVMYDVVVWLELSLRESQRIMLFTLQPTISKLNDSDLLFNLLTFRLIKFI